MADASDVFNTFNNPRSTRTNEDVMGVYKAAHEELEHLSRKFLVNASNGIHVRQQEKWEDGDEDAVGPYSPREHGLYFKDQTLVSAALWLSRFAGLKNTAFLTQPQIVAEMVREWEINQTLATDFWMIVFTEDGAAANHPARVLAESYRDLMKKKYQRPPQWKARAAKAWKLVQSAQPDDTSDESDDDADDDQTVTV